MFSGGAPGVQAALQQAGGSVERRELLAALDSRGDTPLVSALRYDCLTVAIVLLEYSCIDEGGAQLFALGPFGRTAFHCAAERGDVSALQRVLSLVKGPELRGRLLTSTTQDGGWTALHLAANKGKVEAVRALLDGAGAEERGAMLRAEDHRGRTAFLAAVPWIAGEEESQAAMLLLEQSAPERQLAMLLAGDRKGKTLLHHAAEKGQVARAEALLALTSSSAADCARLLSAENVEGRSPLHSAAFGGHEALTRVLLEHAGSEDRSRLLLARDLAGLTPLELSLQARGGGGHESCTSLAATMVLLEYGTSEERSMMLSPKTRGAATIMHRLARAGEEERAAALLGGLGGPEERARLVAEATAKGWTPLHSAACWGQAGMVRILMEHGGDHERARMLASAGAHGETPLHLAVGEKAGDAGAAFCTLLTASTDREVQKLLTARNDAGDTALQRAGKPSGPSGGAAAAAERILAWSDGAGKTLLHYAVESGDVTNVRALLQLAAGSRGRSQMLVAADAHGWTPLHRAARFGQLAACRALLSSARSGEEGEQKSISKLRM